MITRAALILLLTVTLTRGADPWPIVVTGDEQKQIDLNLPDGGLPALPGVANIQVFRASRAAPEVTDGKGWTYHHHVDLGCWKGRLYLAWDSCEKDEDVWPSRELYSTSTDGKKWETPRELFPAGLTTAQRMYFFRSPGDVMLAVTGLRNVVTHVPEWEQGPLVARRILPDHTLGPVYTLRPPIDSKAPGVPPTFSSAPDAEFVQACRALLSNKPFLEQSDYGRLLGDAKMKWHDSSTWPADEPSRPYFQNRFGKAMAFFHRKDGALVAVMKWGWVLVSHDDGETWSSPVRPPTLVAGMAKTWGQRTSDYRYALVYNPDLGKRYPLVQVTGDDGITFGDMRVIHGELPPMRFPGLYKEVGPQYVRGISEWSNDGTFPDPAMWIAYSMSKEDIWVSRVPLSAEVDENLWNIYSPKWAPTSVQREQNGTTSLTLEDRDPADYARAIYMLKGGKTIDVSFTLDAQSSAGQKLQLDLDGPRGQRAVRASLEPGRFRFTADAEASRYSLWRDEKIISENAPLSHPVERFERFGFTTGERPASMAPETDRPIEPAIYHVQGLTMSPPTMP